MLYVYFPHPVIYVIQIHGCRTLDSEVAVRNRKTRSAKELQEALEVFKDEATSIRSEIKKKQAVPKGKAKGKAKAKAAAAV